VRVYKGSQDVLPVIRDEWNLGTVVARDLAWQRGT
jgi:hypothetical protein